MKITYEEYRKQQAVNQQVSDLISEAKRHEEAERRKNDFNTYRVHVGEAIPPTVGILTLDHIPIATEGNISAVVGEAKSKKTFLCSALIGGLLNPTQRSDFGIHNLPQTEVLWVDTEQSRTHVQLTARRVHLLAGYDPDVSNDHFRMLALREVEPKLRSKLLFEALQAWKPRVVVIDGISDLIYNTNDLEESETLITQLMATSSRLKCHIVVVLHTNPNSDKARGHIGSALLRKAETVIYVRKAGECSIAEPQFTRNEPFERFAFRINAEGLPEVCPLPSENEHAYGDVVAVVQELGSVAVERRLVVAKLVEERQCSENNARVRITRALRQGVITATGDGSLLSA